jgi:hypothetical protein
MHLRLALIGGDLLNANTVRRTVDGCQIVAHRATIPGVDTVLKMVVIAGSWRRVLAACPETPMATTSTPVTLNDAYRRVSSSSQARRD